MRIITVIPIARGISKDTLTYFTTKDIVLGSIVSIPLRNKMIYGLVVQSELAENLKSELKSLSYSIKKIDSIKTHSFLSNQFIEATKKIADFNAGSVGSVLSALVPKTVLEESGELEFNHEKNENGVFFETLLLQSDDNERYATYRSLIREEFARNRSVFFCLPSTEDLLNAKTVLEKGIEKYTYLIHGGLPKKEILSLWKKIIEDKHPVLIIGLGTFLSIPRTDLGVIILEKENSRSYKMQQRPFIDIRNAAEFIAKELNIKLVLGDMILRTETLWREKSGKYSQLFPLKFRSLSTAKCEVINTKSPQDMKKKEFSSLSEEMKKILIDAKDNNEHTFLFCGRKGLYPITVCGDCGTVVACNNCHSPVVLYSKSGATKTNDAKTNLFVCNHCGERREAQELCVHCKGWRLNPLGIGIEKIAEEIKLILPDTKILLMDKENVKTHKQAVKMRDLFYSTPGSIMIGTELALTYLNQKIENSAVISIDSYFSIPDFQINEKIFYILLIIRSLTEKNFIIQTRQESVKIFDYATKGNLIDFYRDEINDRKEIGYPPFTTYIKITLEGEKASIKKQMSEIAELMKPYDLSVFDAWNPGGAHKYTVHGLISLPEDKWIDKILLEKLRLLPQNCIVKVNPITLL